MSDLINGREMLKRYQVDLCYGIACKECSMCTEDGGCRVEEWIDTFPSADRPQEWIPCSERLPSKGVAVLVNGTMYDAPPITISIDAPYYYEQGWINAWMPLPEPWEGAEDE